MSTARTLLISGMHCAACAQRVEHALRAVPGVHSARVNFALSQASVELDAPTPLDALQAAVAAEGYGARPLDETRPLDEPFKQQAREARIWRVRFIVACVLLLPQLWGHTLGMTVWFVLASLMQGYVGAPYLLGAWRRLLHRSANMDTLIALGTSAAYLAGVVAWVQGEMSMYWMDAGMILAFITLGKWLETLARGRSSDAIRSLIALAPATATLLRDGQPVTLALSDVGVGETLLVRPGDRVPLDATVTRGTSSVDQAWLTGEPLSVDKQPGDDLFAGTINGSGSLEARVTHAAGDTALARVVELVRRAQESKAPIERVADRVVGWFVPVVLLVAFLTVLGWSLIGGDFTQGLSAAVAVLVVACPCALGLATPTAVLVATGRGAEQGILIKDAAALEVVPQITTFILDKTGTVTRGAPQVVEVLPAPGITHNELLSTAAAVEQLSTHPLAKCVVSEARRTLSILPQARDLHVIAGKGLQATVMGRAVLVGNDKLLVAHQVTLEPFQSAIDAQRERGATPLLVARDGQYLGLISVADTVSPGSREAVAALKQLGAQVLLLSGDHRRSVEAVAREVGITVVHSEVLPDEKQQVVRTLQAQGEKVAMVGDGINDAPALAAAQVGIAMGHGADVAVEAAQIVLAGHDLRQLVRAVQLARGAFCIIRQNLFWAFAYNIVLIPLAAGVFVPWLHWRLPSALAAAAMAVSSVSVVLNSLRIRHI